MDAWLSFASSGLSDTQQCITAANVVVSPRVACRRQFFDLHDMFVRWVNLPQCKDKQLDYSQFLQALGRFQDIPEQEKVRLGSVRLVSGVTGEMRGSKAVACLLF